MTRKPHILPCFRDHEGVLDFAGLNHFVECSDDECGLTGPMCPDPDSAVVIWNFINESLREKVNTETQKFLDGISRPSSPDLYGD